MRSEQITGAAFLGILAFFVASVVYTYVSVDRSRPTEIGDEDRVWENAQKIVRGKLEGAAQIDFGRQLYSDPGRVREVGSEVYDVMGYVDFESLDGEEKRAYWKARMKMPGMVESDWGVLKFDMVEQDRKHQRNESDQKSGGLDAWENFYCQEEDLSAGLVSIY